MIGQSIAHYKIIGKLGAGGMGELYRAIDTRLNRQVTLKAPPQAFAQDAQYRVAVVVNWFEELNRLVPTE